MKTLKEILLVKNEISEFANKLGFTDLRIFCTSDLSKGNIDLTIIVNDIPDRVIPLENSDYLEALLIDKLQCNVKIKVFNRITGLYKDFYTENSAPMNDENKLLKLFGAKHSDFVKFKPISEGTYDDLAFTTLLTSAKDNLKQEGDLPKKPYSTEKADHYSIVGIIGKSPATQKRKPQEVNKGKPEEKTKKAKETNGKNTTAASDDVPAEIKIPRSPLS